MQRGFADLLKEYGGLLSRIAASYEAQPSLRDDLLQDIALALWRAVPTWRGDASMKTFVARVAHNRGASHVSAQMRRPLTDPVSEDLPDLSLGPDTYTERAQQSSRLQDAVRGLPLPLRQAVTLAFEGFSHQEIAAVLGITANNVAVRLSRARQALKAALGECA